MDSRSPDSAKPVRNDLGVYEIDPCNNESDNTGVRFVDDMIIAFCHVLAFGISVYDGVLGSKSFGTVSVNAAASAHQNHVICAMMAILLLGGIGMDTAWSVEKMRQEIRVALSMFSLAALGVAGTFLWNSLLHPNLPQLLHDLQLTLSL